MSNSDFDSRDDRSAALDRFARDSGQGASREVSIPQQAFSVGGDRIIGAQAVAVYRDEARVMGKLRALAAAAGSEWGYRIPFRNRKENRTDYVEGPSIKLANDLARIYGNCDIDCRVTDIGDAWLIYARFTDFETGFSMTRPFQQRKGASKVGGGDDARNLDMALQIGASKAIRNVVVNALQTYADFAFEESRNAIVSKIGTDLPKWRTNIRARLAEHVAIDRVERVIGRPVGEWLAPDIAKAMAMMKGVQDGMASLDETFPLAVAGEDGSKAAADKFAAAAETVDPQTGEVSAVAGAEKAKRTRRTKAQMEADAAAERKPAQQPQDGDSEPEATEVAPSPETPPQEAPAPTGGAIPPAPTPWPESTLVKTIGKMDAAKSFADLQDTWSVSVVPSVKLLPDVQYQRLVRAFDRREKELAE